MEQPHADEPVRDTRTIRNAAPRHPMRPFLIGVAVVAVLGGAIVAASRYERARVGDPAALVSPGAMHVGETEVLPPGLSGAPKPDAGARGTGPVPVKFYEVLEKGDQAALGGGDIAMRSMPLPPPPDAEAALKPMSKSAPKEAPKVVAQAPAAAPATTMRPAESAPEEETAAPAAPAMASAPPAPAPPGPSMARPYTLQVGSFSRERSAEELVARLKDKGHEAYMTEVDLGSKGVWYRVRVGRFPTEHAAKWARLDLVRDGLSPIVVHDPKGP
jgi:cell division septation protein DedD